jgi:DNA-binding transcriptional regulator LsrR (DeoR family)
MDYESQKIALGKVAADLFDELVTTGKSVAIGGGGSIKAMVEAIPVRPREIFIAPMALVGRGPQVEFVDAAFLASLLYYKSSPKAHALVVGMLPPPKVENARKAFFEIIEKSIPEVKTVLEYAKNSLIAFVGLGGPDPVPELVPILARTGIATSTFIHSNAVGGINYNYFDKHGQEIARLYRTVSIPELQTMAEDTEKVVIAVAGGTHKTQPILIALRTRMVNALVTDEKSALRLSKER